MDQHNTFLGTEEPALVTPTSDDKTMAILSHILCIVAGFLAPLIIYLVKKDNSPFATAHAKESLNFQLTLIIVYIACGILTAITLGLLVFLFFLVMIAALILVILATIKASEGKFYKYPFSIKFVK